MKLPRKYIRFYLRRRSIITPLAACALVVISHYIILLLLGKESIDSMQWTFVLSGVLGVALGVLIQRVESINEKLPWVVKKIPARSGETALETITMAEPYKGFSTIKIMDISIRYLMDEAIRDRFFEVCTDAMKRGINFQLLLLDPTAKSAEQRLIDLDEDIQLPMEENIRALFKFRAELASELQPKFEVRLYNSVTTFTYFQVLDEAFFSFYPASQKSHEAPNLQISMHHSKVGAYTSAFYDQLWANKERNLALEDYLLAYLIRNGFEPTPVFVGFHSTNTDDLGFITIGRRANALLDYLAEHERDHQRITIQYRGSRVNYNIHRKLVKLSTPSKTDPQALAQTIQNDVWSEAMQSINENYGGLHVVHHDDIIFELKPVECAVSCLNADKFMLRHGVAEPKHWSVIPSQYLRISPEVKHYMDYFRLQEDFDHLVIDHHLQATGSNYRKRRFGRFEFNPSLDTLSVSKDQSFHQSKEVNKLLGGIVRDMPPLRDHAWSNTFLKSLIRMDFDLLGLHDEFYAMDWEVCVHQIRIEAPPGTVGDPSPEGPHSDGHQFLVLHLMKRVNVQGGVSSILAWENVGKELERLELTDALDTIVIDDKRVQHNATRIMALDQSKGPAYRDILIIDFDIAKDKNASAIGR
jgi:hypothetical protein